MQRIYSSSNMFQYVHCVFHIGFTFCSLSKLLNVKIIAFKNFVFFEHNFLWVHYCTFLLNFKELVKGHELFYILILIIINNLGSRFPIILVSPDVEHIILLTLCLPAHSLCSWSSCRVVVNNVLGIGSCTWPWVVGGFYLNSTTITCSIL